MRRGAFPRPSGSIVRRRCLAASTGALKLTTIYTPGTGYTISLLLRRLPLKTRNCFCMYITAAVDRFRASVRPPPRVKQYLPKLCRLVSAHHHSVRLPEILLHRFARSPHNRWSHKQEEQANVECKGRYTAWLCCCNVDGCMPKARSPVLDPKF